MDTKNHLALYVIFFEQLAPVFMQTARTFRLKTLPCLTLEDPIQDGRADLHIQHTLSTAVYSLDFSHDQSVIRDWKDRRWQHSTQQQLSNPLKPQKENTKHSQQ